MTLNFTNQTVLSNEEASTSPKSYVCNREEILEALKIIHKYIQEVEQAGELKDEGLVYNRLVEDFSFNCCIDWDYLYETKWNSIPEYEEAPQHKDKNGRDVFCF